MTYLTTSGAVRPTITIVEEGDTRTVQVQVPGPPGPSGITAYVHQQSVSSTTWTIAHNLGFKPSVELLNTASQEIDGDVVHISNNVTVISFNVPVAGLARLI